jgi:hypothetical protein
LWRYRLIYAERADFRAPLRGRFNYRVVAGAPAVVMTRKLGSFKPIRDHYGSSMYWPTTIKPSCG